MSLYIEDLNQIILYSKKDLLSLKKSNIFISGGTGYIGKWILETLLFSNKILNLNLKVILLSRNPVEFKKNYPHIYNDKALKIIKGDIRNFKYPKNKIDYVIHAATDVVKSITPLENFDVITNGTKHILEFCKLKNIKDILILSSGAVYGTVPQKIKKISENYFGLPDLKDPGSAYGLGKLISEWMGSIYSNNYFFSCKYARIFAQIGPYLALNKQYVIGNLISNLINKDDLIIKGNGKVKRSYMYGADLIIWLLAILIRGKNNQSYNVGSDQAISIIDLAKKIALTNNYPITRIKVLNEKFSNFGNRDYIPNTSLANKELSLRLITPLDVSLSKTIQWFLQKEKI